MSENRPRNSQSRLISAAIFGFFVLLILIIFSNATFLTIDADERGILFRRFGGGLDKEKIYTPGFHVIAPWNRVYIFDIKDQKLEETMKVLSSDGLNIDVDITIRVRPKFDKIGDILETFGERQEYIERLVRPEVRSSVRQQLGQFTPEELYSSKRDEVQGLIQQDLEATLSRNFVELRATLIRDIELPEKVRTAIEEKLEAEQAALKYEYILDQERKEAERRIIEAEAKAESNRILSASLSANILRDKGIEATIKLAESENTKVIVVGGDSSDGLPLILGGGGN